MAEKFMQKMAAGMKKRGTEGSLRAAAGKKEGQMMTEADLDRMEKKARSMTHMVDGKKKMTEEGLKLMRKVMGARRMMKSKK